MLQRYALRLFGGLFARNGIAGFLAVGEFLHEFRHFAKFLSVKLVHVEFLYPRLLKSVCVLLQKLGKRFLFGFELLLGVLIYFLVYSGGFAGIRLFKRLLVFLYCRKQLRISGFRLVFKRRDKAYLILAFGKVEFDFAGIIGLRFLVVVFYSGIDDKVVLVWIRDGLDARQMKLRQNRSGVNCK